MKEGWEIIDLGSVCHVQRGLTYSGKDTVDISDQVVLRATNIDLGTGKLNFDELKYLREDLEIKPVYALKKDSLLICFSSGSKSHLGKIALVDDDYPNFFFGGFIGQINPSEKIDSKYLFYCLSSETYKDYISNLTDGVNINNLKATDLKSFQIPLPPLPEQQRIVSILDKAFAAIDKAKANAEQNLQNAKALFESYLQGVFEKKGDGWEEKTLGEIAFVKSGGTPLRHKTEYWSGDIAWYSSGELNNLYTSTPLRHINELAIENSNAKLFPKGSLLIGMYDTAALKMSILDRDAAFNQAIAGVKPNPEIDLIFILHAINSIKPDILNLRRGVRQKNLSLQKIKNISISIPPLKAQQTIVRQLDALRAETQKLEAVYQKKIADLEELKKSILQKAFSGQLSESRIMAD